MDITKLCPVRISPSAKDKIIKEFFPSVTLDEFEDPNITTRESNIHAGALALYSATLITKVYETNANDIERESSAREAELSQLIKANPKYAHYSDEEVSNKVKELIIKDIRNCFAHGNFEISYDIHTKKLYYVLQSKRKDFVSDKPIVISKNALLKVNKKFIEPLGRSLSKLSPSELSSRACTHLNMDLKRLIIPVEMLKLAEHFLNLKTLNNMNQSKYALIHYVLLASKITYEQNDYYEMFGKDSNIFQAISHIRNSIAHDGFSFINGISTIQHQDRANLTTDSIEKNVSILYIADIQKSLINSVKKNNHSEHAINDLKEELKKIFTTISDNYDEILTLDYDE